MSLVHAFQLASGSIKSKKGTGDGFYMATPSQATAGSVEDVNWRKDVTTF